MEEKIYTGGNGWGNLFGAGFGGFLGAILGNNGLLGGGNGNAAAAAAQNTDMLSQQIQTLGQTVNANHASDLVLGGIKIALQNERRQVMNDHIKKFDELYKKMSESSDIKDMELFGKVMREAITLISERMPDRAEEMIEKFEAINYKNYLTKKEAEGIISAMTPSPMWGIDRMKNAIAAMGATKEEEPCYNEYALYTTIAMVSSDSGETLEKYAGATDEGKQLELCYHLALDKLKDKDGMFNIRKYFCV